MGARLDPAEIAKRKEALGKPFVPKVIKAMARANVRIFRLTRGRVGGQWRIMAGFRKPAPILLLDHVGRKSGRQFTTPLVYVRHRGESGDGFVVIGSQGGLPKHPQWYLNLREHPDTQVQVRLDGRLRTLPVRARVAEGAERAALWREANEVYADFDTYQLTADRVIPVVVLEPR